MRTQDDLIKLLEEAHKNLEKYILDKQNTELLKKALFAVIVAENNLKLKGE